ncbi:MAG: HlyD family efflux transporter periplasmic adaptor subunit [Lewinellaceae bacterium]|nr:HlyD family efflux transporter periplasmic adaptor subunit [Lewinella sp.]MCB9277665.1 HlyD family efflux transporter periplasmic adaptor subunit [Lewinellaceae bacterium]
MRPLYFLLLSAATLTACTQQEEQADAFGNFEADPVSVGAEASGRLVWFDVREGEHLAADRLIGLVDTSLLYLQKQQVLATMQALGKKTQDPLPQIEVLQEQRNYQVGERKRIEALLADKAATPKQLDDINAQIAVLDKQIDAARKQSQTANRGILSENDPLRAQLAILDEQLDRCYIRNPVSGTVLTKIAEADEMVAPGGPLYRIAPLDTLILRAYISGNQLASVKLGQNLYIQVDGTDKSYNGRITWISDQSEFTPKMVQTKDERINLVYAVKIAVPNDGSLKIGMPAEVYFSMPPQQQEQ